MVDRISEVHRLLCPRGSTCSGRTHPGGPRRTVVGARGSAPQDVGDQSGWQGPASPMVLHT